MGILIANGIIYGSQKLSSGIGQLLLWGFWSLEDDNNYYASLEDGEEYYSLTETE